MATRMKPVSTTEGERMGHKVRLPYVRQNRAHVASVDHRLADRWGCAIGTAKARRERSIPDALAVIRACVESGDSERLGHYMSLFDAALTCPAAEDTDAILVADRADAEEDVLECAYRENPSKQTARAWLDALGREGRANEPAMVALRERWEL